MLVNSTQVKEFRWLHVQSFQEVLVQFFQEVLVQSFFSVLLRCSCQDFARIGRKADSNTFVRFTGVHTKLKAHLNLKFL